MRALVWHGKNDVRIDKVPDPVLQHPQDIIVEVTSTAICGSDLHLYAGYIPAVEAGDILGHEFMGRVVDVGKGVTTLVPGDRVVVPFSIACGHCHFCAQSLTALCDESNPNGTLAAKLYGYAPAALFGYTKIYGGFAGGQAELVRVPYADVGPLKLPDGVSDEHALFLSDILPTAYMAIENLGLKGGETVVVWGLGPVGQMCVRCAWLQGAGRVIAIDRFAERLRMAAQGRAETIDYSRHSDIPDLLKDMTRGRGPEAVVDAVGMESHGTTIGAVYDNVKHRLKLTTDRSHALREAISACGKGGVVSVPGVYGGWLDKFPLGIAFAKGLTLKMGQTQVHRYMRPLLQRIVKNEIDPTFVITHRMPLDEAPKAYRNFQEKREGTVKVVLKP